jgi:hypothetical protein
VCLVRSINSAQAYIGYGKLQLLADVLIVLLEHRYIMASTTPPPTGEHNSEQRNAHVHVDVNTSRVGYEDGKSWSL